MMGYSLPVRAVAALSIQRIRAITLPMLEHWRDDCSREGFPNFEENQERQMKMNKQHGKSGTPEYNSFTAMIARCFSPCNKSFYRYGGRPGNPVKVCRRLRKSIVWFLYEMGRKPTPKHTIDRINGAGHYSCGHCRECKEMGWERNVRWATQQQQQRHKTSNRMLTHDGRTMCVREWDDFLGFRTGTIFQRLFRGWSIEKSLTSPTSWAAKMRSKNNG